MTKNIRIRPETHDLLVRIAEREGRFQHAVVDLALQCYDFRWARRMEMEQLENRLAEIHEAGPIPDLPFDAPE